MFWFRVTQWETFRIYPASVLYFIQLPMRIPMRAENTIAPSLLHPSFPLFQKIYHLALWGGREFPPRIARVHCKYSTVLRKLNTIQAEQICTTCFLFKWTRLLNRRYCTVHHYDHHGAPSRLSPLHGPIMLQRRRLVNKDIVFRCCRGLPLPQRLDNVRKASNT